MFNVDIIQYNIFKILGSEYKMKKAFTDQEFFDLIEGIELETYQMFRYPELANDCKSLLADFIYFIEIKELEQYFKPKFDNNIIY
jgi:hypothetical protein